MSHLKDFIRTSDDVVEFKTHLEERPSDSLSEQVLQIHREEILRRWHAFKECYDSILGNFELAEEKVPLQTIKARFYSTYEAHTQALARVNKLLHDARASASEVDSLDHTRNISLPPCDTEIFSGDYKSWPTFRDMFTALYKNNKRLSPVEKMCHLLKKTQGEARDLLKTCPITNDGFDMAWTNLVKRYENKRVLINAQLKDLFNISPISKETGPNIRRLQRVINDCITNLTLLHIDTANWDIIFVYICSTCLPEVTLNLWEHSLPHTTALPTWKQMDDFLTSRFQTLESVADIRSTFSNPHQPNSQRNTSSKKTHGSDQRKLNNYSIKVSNEKLGKCPLCSYFHRLQSCSVFLKMSTEERYTVVRQQKRCTNCLASSHESKNCKSKYTCNVCSKRHHTLLHRAEPKISGQQPSPVRGPPSAQRPTPVIETNQGPSYLATQVLDTTPSSSKEFTTRNLQSYSSHIQSISPAVVLGTALIDVYNEDIKCTVRALIDSGSEATFISRRLQKKLCLRTQDSQAEIHGLSGSLTATATQICHVKLGSPVDPSFEIYADALIVKRLTGRLSHPISDRQKECFAHLRLADSSRHQASEIDVLLGGDVYPKIIKNGLHWDEDRSLMAQNSVLGWIITGKVQYNPCRTSVSSFFNEIALAKQLQRFWELEDIPKAKKEAPEDLYCEQFYQKTTFRNSEGRFVVSLPFRQEYPKSLNMGASRHIAVSQFLRNEARLLKNPLFKADYDRVISEYSTLEQMKCVAPATDGDSTYYMPHHAICKLDSTTTKLRVVFNASSPSSNGVSLNDLLYPGPILQADLTILILRWRMFRYVFNADIEKMYRQIRINPANTPFQRIIFRDHPDEPLRDYELTTVTFGVNCAPYLAIRTLLELAQECESSHPHVAEILRHYMYVDDVLAGAHTISSAIQARSDLTTVLEKAGFALRKWTANNNCLLKDIPPQHLLGEEFLKLSDTSITKTLGLRWNAGRDYFYFKLKTKPDRNLSTKRLVLSEIARLFDPAGWLSPKVVTAKIIMQQIWKDGTEWDEELCPSTLRQWHEFLDDYVQVERIKIPRFVDFDPSYSVELHGFSDASEKAYAAALYLRTEYDGFVTTHLLAAKTKVAPVKFLSLPRKELCGAELMATMIESMQSQLGLKNYRLYLWTDSTIVLAWLQKPTYSWKTFVENRISSIIEKVGNDSWYHVDSKSNPADLATRGLTVEQLSMSDLWWKGPPWLKLPPSAWPSRASTFTTAEEAKPIRVHATTVQQCDILQRFSNLPRALRVTCHIYRFYFRLKDKLRKDYVTDELTSAELNFAKDRLVIASQRTHFPREYTMLSEGLPVPRKSNLLTLNPFIDTLGIMRVNGRVANSPVLSYDERYPILLPYYAHFTRLLLTYLHQYSLHGQNALLYRLVRLHYYVPKLKTLIKAVLSKCVICVKHKRQTRQQVMAALPPERSGLSRPFYDTGVDFAGPFDIKSYAGRGCKVTKGYVLVFICFATKAIHLEATGEISTQAFLAAFSRFFSRRGTPRALYSDNGTAFVGASNNLNAANQQFLSLVRKDVLARDSFASLEWHFIPPGAPHMGGLWEAGVKSVKSHFKKVCRSQSFTFEEFSTMLARIEACLNSRPLSPMSDDPTNLCALTPGHFLIGAPLLSPPEPDLTSHSLSYANRWERLKVLHQQLALRWKKEYLIELHKRVKWKYPQRDCAVDDLVVIKHDNLPPNKWRLGRIIKVFQGPDERVRVAEIRTTDGIVTRPITKLVLLP